jgi:hypothetical protein
MKIRPTEEHDERGNPIFEVDESVDSYEELGREIAKIPHSGLVVLRLPDKQWAKDWLAHVERLKEATEKLAARGPPTSEDDGEDD